MGWFDAIVTILRYIYYALNDTKRFCVEFERATITIEKESPSVIFISLACSKKKKFQTKSQVSDEIGILSFEA